MSEAAEESGQPAAPKKPLNIGVLLLALNTVAVLGAAGFMAYTKLVFKRPEITEHGERQKIAKLKQTQRKATSRALIDLGVQQVNILPTPAEPRGISGTAEQIQGKLHYAQVGLSIEIRDEELKTFITDSKSLLLDKFLSLIGRKGFNELTTVQGRYVLRAEIIDVFNEVVAALPGGPKVNKEGMITNVFFTHFIVQ